MAKVVNMQDAKSSLSKLVNKIRNYDVVTLW